MKTKILSMLVMLGVLFSSCEDYLTKTPHDGVPYENIFKTTEDFDVALKGVYSALKSSSYYGRLFTVYPDILTDQVTSIIGYSNQLGILHTWDFTAGDGDIEAMWAQMYYTIARANTILDRIDPLIEAGGDDVMLLKQIKGEALAIRAMVHFDLVRLFAPAYNAATASSDLGVPYMLKFETGNPARDNVKMVYDNIVSDLLKATTSLNDETMPSVPNSYNFTIGAANALLARVYLYMKDYPNAIKYAQMVVNNEKYKLTSGNDFASMWLNDEGDEVILRIGLTVNDAAGKYPGYNYYNDSQGPPNPDYMPTNAFMSKFDTADIRYKTYMVYEDTKYGYPLTMISKYPTNPEFASTSNANGSNMPKILRLAEQYLILAEAYAESDPGTAWGYIQTLKANRLPDYDPSSDPAPANIMDAIFAERQLEMAFEGHMFFDYKRLGKGFTRQGRTADGNNEHAQAIDPLVIEADNNKWIFPIPQAEIAANDGISSDDQNAGY